MKGGLEEVVTGDEMGVDGHSGVLKIPSRGIELKFPPLVGLAKQLVESGGLVNYMRQRIKRGEIRP
jgi:hypothetical protein